MRAELPRRGNHAPITVELIHSKCTECGDCWIWGGAKAHNAPYISQNRKSISVRRWLAHHKGLQIKGRLASTTCMTEMCVNPDHMITVTRAALQKTWSDKLQYSRNPVRNAKLSAIKSAQSPHSEETVAKIREMAETAPSQRAIARALNVNFDFVNRVIRGTTRKTYASNPFGGMVTGLMR